MLTYEFFFRWLLVMFPLVYSPGPANTMFASSGAQFGFRKSIPFMIGINCAFIAQSLLTGFGLSGLLLRYPLAFMLLRYAGIAYIVYLGAMFLKAAVKKTKEQPECLTFWDGMLLTAVNPKAWVMQVMMFSQFLEQGDAWLGSIFKLSVLLALLNVTGHIVWILFGSILLSRQTTGFSPRMQNGLYAAMLFGSIWFLL